MALLIIAMLVVVALGVAVVGLVAVPARRDGRDLLTDRSEDAARSAWSGVRDHAILRGLATWLRGRSPRTR